MLLAGFIPISVAIHIQLKSPLRDGLRESTGMAFAGLGIILQYIMLPLMVFVVWTIRQFMLDNNTFYSIFGFLYFHVRKGRRHRAFRFIFVFRRFVLLCVMFSMDKSPPIAQILLLLTVNLGMVIFIGFVEPLKTRAANMWELFNEFMITVITLFTLYFSGDQPDLEMQYKMGWVMIGLFTLLLLINF